jgi:hypothetical protein
VVVVLGYLEKGCQEQGENGIEGATVARVERQELLLVEGSMEEVLVVAVNAVGVVLELKRVIEGVKEESL